jgi:hypothetical protein
MIMALIVFVIYFFPCFTSIELRGSDSIKIVNENALTSNFGVIPDQIKLNINASNCELFLDNKFQENNFGLQYLQVINNKFDFIIISNYKLRSTIKPTCYTGFNYLYKLHSYNDPENLS